MKLEGRITFLIQHDRTILEIEDDNASTTFLKAELTPEQTIDILSHRGKVECKLDVRGLDKVGKKHENKDFVFEIPKDLLGVSFHSEKLEELKIHAQKLLDEQGDDWVSDGYFNSQNSFFTKDKKEYARVTIRRWI